MTHEIFNLSNILGAVAFLLLIASVGFGAGGNIFLSVISAALFSVFAFFYIKEDGRT